MNDHITSISEPSDIHLLLCGVPATGKSTFAKWLVETHGFRHHDVDWDGSPTDDASSGTRVVIDWGFPASDPRFEPAVRAVRSLIARGYQHWWFDGDRDAALSSFLKRGTVSKANWDIQLAGIDNHWAEISRLFKGRQLVSIAQGPRYTPPTEIFSIMFPDGL